MSDLTIIVPAYNEETSIQAMLEVILPACEEHDWQVIVVNDGSKDRTREAVQAILPHQRLRLINHPVNRGYGAALKTGVRVAETPFVATMDSDGQHRLEDMLMLAQAKADYDLVIGKRTALLHSSLWRMPGKWLLQSMAVYLLRRTIPDLNSGLRIFRREVLLKYLHLFPDGFSFSTTSTMLFMHRGYAVEFFPIEVRPRKGSRSTVSLSTGFDTLLLIIRLAMLLDPLRLFLPVSFLLVTVGMVWTVPFLIQREGYSIGALLLIMTGILIFAVALLSDQIAALRKEKFE
jgi:glycosyltransferase involved in cell wall biosynthesis